MLIKKRLVQWNKPFFCGFLGKLSEAEITQKAWLLVIIYYWPLS